MLIQYPKFKKGEVEKIHKNLNNSEKSRLKNYLLYRESRGLSKRGTQDIRRYLLQLYKIIGGDFLKINSEIKASKLSLVISNSYLSLEVRKNLLINTQNALKYFFNDWSVRFRGLEMFNRKKLNKGENSKKRDYEILTDDEIRKIFQTEKSNYWKTFFKIQEQTGGRTKEIRTLENKNISFNEDGTSTIKIYMSKTGKTKFVFCDNEATNLIKKLQEEQENLQHKGKYLFYSAKNKEKSISKNQVNFWFRHLTLKAIGKKCQNYQLRHRRATILYKLANENKISDDTAIKLLGHSKSMKEKYTHISEKERIKILKAQVFLMNIPKKKKHQLELKIENLKKEMELMEKKHILTEKNILNDLGFLKEYLRQSGDKKLVEFLEKENALC